VFVVLVVSTLAFVGLGLFAAVFPVMSAERGAEATHIFQGSLLLVSGVYYPIDVLPGWMQPLSAISPATYTLSACRKLFGVGNAASTPELLAGAPLSAVSHELLILALMGAILLPLGLMTFVRVEAWAKRTGKLKRTGILTKGTKEDAKGTKKSWEREDGKTREYGGTEDARARSDSSLEARVSRCEVLVESFEPV
jgi:ABC-2 type transport system permease protein